MSLEKKSNPSSARIVGIAIMLLGTIALYVIGWIIATMKLYPDYSLDWYSLRFFVPAIAEVLPIVFYVLWFNKADSFSANGTGRSDQCADFADPNGSNGVNTKSGKIMYLILSIVLPIIVTFIICVASNKGISYRLDYYTKPLLLDQGIICILQVIVNVLTFNVATPFNSR